MTHIDIQKDLAFPREEYLARLSAVRREMDLLGIDALVSTIPENICYLSGFHTPGYYYPEFLIIFPDRDPLIFVRAFEGKNVDAYSWLDTSRRVVFQDYEDAAVVFARALVDDGGSLNRIGFELNSWFLTVRNFEKIRTHLGKIEIVDVSGVIEKGRMVKSEREIAYIRRSCEISSIGLAAARAHCQTALGTENDLAAEIHRAIVKEGSEYPGLPLFLSSGHRSLIPHAIWSDKKIEKTDNIIIELTGITRRYAGPLFRTFHIGRPEQEILDRARVVEDMLEATIDAIRPGVTSHNVNQAAVKASGEYGKGVTKRAGYSIGINFPPDWGEGVFLDLKNNDETILRPGMTFHIPQSIRIPGRQPVAISETVLVTKNGCEILTDFERSLIVIDWSGDAKPM